MLIKQNLAKIESCTKKRKNLNKIYIFFPKQAWHGMAWKENFALRIYLVKF